ncbi:common pilus major fimbrillin subunit EcpA [Burkholderia cepacia]|uniref:common pilus major fimbrillin subunit EcpA n=1 Tax=Burkholderia cepacia TaxID=292 RepID=UPI00158EBC16|nr:common pilus major fimbrillin subunit EcpA [Burkholderia cepacia]
MNKNVLGATLAAALSIAAIVPAVAETTTAEASVKWSATAVKKSDVTLNVFQEGDTSLDMKWNPSTSQFQMADRALTIQAAGYSDATAYRITAQVTQDRLDSISAGAKNSLKVGVKLGGIVLGSAPVNILEGANGAPTTAADGLKSMNLASAGANKTPNGSYHQATGVPVKFSIIGGNDATGKVVAVDKLTDLVDDNYSGNVEVRFVASWERPAATETKKTT